MAQASSDPRESPGRQETFNSELIALLVRIAGARADEDAYWLSLDVQSLCGMWIERNRVAAWLYPVWGNLTDGWELVEDPASRTATANLMRRAAEEWLTTPAPEPEAYCERWAPSPDTPWPPERPPM